MSLSFASILKGIVKYLKFTALFAAVAFAGILMGEQSLNQKHKLEEKRLLLKKEAGTLAAEIRSLERQITLLRENPRTIEKVAKKKLGMARPDETVYVFDLGRSTSSEAVGSRSRGDRAGPSR
jgi:cell division protein FtsB